MKRLLITALLVGASGLSVAGTAPDTWSTPTGNSYKSSNVSCQKTSESRTQCDVTKPNWKIKPVSHHFVLNQNAVNLEALMFKGSQYDSIATALSKDWGVGKDDITKTSLSWKVKDWLYTLSKNPNGEVALIGVKN